MIPQSAILLQGHVPKDVLSHIVFQARVWHIQHITYGCVYTHATYRCEGVLCDLIDTDTQFKTLKQIIAVCLGMTSTVQKIILRCFFLVVGFVPYRTWIFGWLVGWLVGRLVGSSAGSWVPQIHPRQSAFPRSDCHMLGLFGALRSAQIRKASDSELEANDRGGSSSCECPSVTLKRIHNEFTTNSQRIHNEFTTNL